MTVVAGFRHTEGVLLGSDCRLTFKSPKGTATHSDRAQKIFRLGAANAFGFAGHVETLSALVGNLLFVEGERRRLDPISVSRWLPRWLRAAHSALRRTLVVGPVQFMVASSMGARPLRMSWSDVWTTVEKTARADISAHCFALRFLNELPATSVQVDVPDSSDSLLYTMDSESGFAPVFFREFECAAIGSGAADAVRTLRRYLPLLVADEIRLVTWFFDALHAYLGETKERSVGGMLLAGNIHHGKVTLLALTNEMPGSTRRIELTLRNGRFYARDSGTQTEVLLRYPSELIGVPVAPLLFDGLREQERADLERRARVEAILAGLSREPHNS